MKNFPKGFYWGAATASYQVEGGIDNCDWAKAATEGRVPVCGRACDHYHRYEQDFDLVASLGHNSHRFSVEWARIEPQEGQFDEDELEHYRNVIRALQKRNIVPFITLYHFTLPLWFSENGGWDRKDSPVVFARYCEKVALAFKDLGVIHYSTINEPVVMGSNGWLRGNWPPFKNNHLFGYLKATRNMAYAHNAACSLIKSVQPTAQVSIVKDNIYFHSSNVLFKPLASFMRWFWNRRFLNMVSEHIDAIGLNYYFHKEFGGRGGYKKNDMGWDLYPEGLYRDLIELKQYKVPIYISEAGIADADDDQRAEYIKGLVSETYRAIQDGVNVQGFMYWSLLDNYEWALGFEKRFGLIEIDYDTLERKIRPSAYVYKQICEQNAVVE